MSERIKTAIIGPGAWGRNVARELAAASELVAYAAREPDKHRGWFAEHAPRARALPVEAIAADPDIRAVAIATPIPTLAPLARRMIEAGKHVLVEKPAAGTSAEAQALGEEAARRCCLLAAGYVFLYHPVYRELKRRIDPAQVRGVRLNREKFGTFGEDIAPSLAVHHLALALDLLGEPASGTVAYGPGVKSACDTMEMHLFYAGSEVVSLIDRVSARRSHGMTVELADGSSLVWEEDRLFALRGGTRNEIFRAEPATALRAEVSEFVAAASGESTALPSAGDFAARVLRLLESLQRH